MAIHRRLPAAGRAVRALRARVSRAAATRALLWTVAALWAAAARAQSPEQPSDVLVTASRITESLDEVLWSSDVITRQDITAQQALSLQDLLADLAGAQIANAGGLGKVTSLFLRGTNSDQTLVLINGVPASSATLGTPPLELIPVDEIDRIEVVRGPRSTLYGSDAIGGVIQIFTQSGAQPGLSVDGSATAGSYSTFNGSLGARYGGESFWLGANGGILHTTGFPGCSGQVSPPAGCGVYEPDRDDGFLQRSGSFGAGVQLAPGWNASVRSLLTSGSTVYDGSDSDNTNFDERITSLQLDGALPAHWQLKALIGRNENDEHDYLGSMWADTFETRRDNATLQFEGPLGQVLSAVLGADRVQDHVTAQLPPYALGNQLIYPMYDRTSRDTTAGFSELHAEAGPFTGLAGVRYEYNDQFGDHVTGDVGAAWKLTPQYRLTATWGTAFHAPTFNDLYYPDYGNPALKPEESHSAELGIEAHWTPSLIGTLNVYQTDIADLITYDPVTFMPQNIDSARIRGVELRGEWRGEHWVIAGQATGLDPIDTSPGANGQTLPLRAKSTAFLDLRRLWGTSASIDLRAHWEGRRYDTDFNGNPLPLGGFFLLDVLAEKTFRSGWTVQGRIGNALDRDYHLAAFYNQPGRTVSLTVRYHFAERNAP